MPYPLGDINQDGVVDVFDLSIMVSVWGSDDAGADLNNDGVVDAFDLSILVGNWGETASVTTFAIRVVDSNEEPISGAAVELAPSGGGAVIADISGTFGWITFTDVPVGTYILTATRTDYEDTIINNFLVAEGMSDPWITMTVAGSSEPEPDPDEIYKKIILDTDFAADVDDLGAVAVLHALANNGECEIVGTVVSSKCEWSAVALDATNTWHGRGGLPIGQYTGAAEHSSINSCSDASSNYTKEIAENSFYPQTQYNAGSSIPDAVNTYRQLLSQAGDNSITVVTIGFLTALSELLNSPGDGIDARNGIDLVAAKVKHIYVMGGRNGSNTEYNLDRAPAASANVMDNCPVEITFNPWDIGSVVITGTTNFSWTDHIVRYGYDVFDSVHWTTTSDGHRSWDHVTVLQAIRGNGPWFSTERGIVTMNIDTGKETFTPSSSGPHYWTSLNSGQASVLEDLIEPLMWTPRS